MVVAVAAVVVPACSEEVLGCAFFEVSAVVESLLLFFEYPARCGTLGTNL